MKKVRYLCVETNLGTRRLAKFTSGGDGSVYVTFAPSGKFAKAETLEGLLRASKDMFDSHSGENKISLHSSKNSDRINQVIHRLDTTRNLYTSALKQEGLFTTFRLMAVSDLNLDRHAHKRTVTPNDTVLTKYDSQNNTLFYALVLGPKDREFVQIQDHPSHLNKMSFTEFNVWIIWNFFNWPSTSKSINFTYFGGSPADPLIGIENFEVYNQFTAAKAAYESAYFTVFGTDK